MFLTFSKYCDPEFFIVMFIEGLFKGLEAGLIYNVRFYI